MAKKEKELKALINCPLCGNKKENLVVKSPMWCCMGYTPTISSKYVAMQCGKCGMTMEIDRNNTVLNPFFRQVFGEG